MRCARALIRRLGKRMRCLYVLAIYFENILVIDAVKCRNLSLDRIVETILIGVIGIGCFLKFSFTLANRTQEF